MFYFVKGKQLLFVYALEVVIIYERYGEAIKMNLISKEGARKFEISANVIFQVCQIYSIRKTRNLIIYP